VLGSVEDHVPTRWWLATHGEDSLRALAREGVTHLLVGDLAFFPKAYPFMAPEALEEQLAGPARRLRELLLRDATRLHAAGRWEVWRLDPASKAEIQGPLPHADVPAGEQGQAASGPPGEASPEARALDARGSPR
jgi:hypothetical protein